MTNRAPRRTMLSLAALAILTVALMSPGAQADGPAMLAPNIGSEQLAIDMQAPPHRITLPERLNAAGGVYWGLYKICVDTAGAVSNVTTVKSAGGEPAGALDAHWMKAIKTWRYRPYTIAGAAVPFCYTLRLQVGASVGSIDGIGPGAKMVAPTIGSAQLLTDVNQPPHKPTMPPDLARPGNTIWGLYKICVNAAGGVARVSLVESADPSADHNWMKTIHTWRYRPYTVDGKAVPFCYTLRLQVSAT